MALLSTLLNALTPKATPADGDKVVVVDGSSGQMITTLKSSLVPAVGTTAGTVAAGDDSRFPLIGGGAFAFPADIYAAVGIQATVYLDSMAAAIDPMIRWDVAASGGVGIGAQYADRWQYTPADATADATTVTFSAYTQSRGYVSGKTANLHVIGTHAAYSPGILLIGDSTGNGTALALATLTSADANITATYIGTQGTTAHNEAWGGKSVAWFYSDAASPFVFSGAWDYSQYLTTHSYATPKIVIIQLGINDVFNQTTDAAVATVFAANYTKLLAIIASIKAKSENTWTLINTATPPSDQDHFAVDYGVGNTEWRHRRNIALYNEALISASWPSGVIVVPTSTAINRKTGYIDGYGGGVHPSDSGYAEIAKSVFGAVKYVASVAAQVAVSASDWFNSAYNYTTVNTVKTNGSKSGGVVSSSACNSQFGGVALVFSGLTAGIYNISARVYVSSNATSTYLGVILANGGAIVTTQITAGGRGNFSTFIGALNYYGIDQANAGNWITITTQVNLSDMPAFDTLLLHLSARNATSCALYTDYAKIDMAATTIAKV